MQKIIVFGLGENYRKYKETLNQRWEIVGITDNNILANKSEDLFLEPEMIKNIKNVKILVCVKDSYLDIYKQLLDYGVKKEDILSVSEMMYEDAVFEWKKGGSKLPPPEEYKRMIVKQYAILRRYDRGANCCFSKCCFN